jgi:hypothetical protein
MNGPNCVIVRHFVRQKSTDSYRVSECANEVGGRIISSPPCRGWFQFSWHLAFLESFTQIGVTNEHDAIRRLQNIKHQKNETHFLFRSLPLRE